jgi:hypothetical protein
MRFLRTNTAVIITVGPFYDKTDGVTIETGLTITNERITLTADTDNGSAPTNILDNVTGATSGTANDLNYITGNDAGMMQLELAAADVNRVGRMFLSITDAANHVPVFHELMVLPAQVYDSLILGTDLLDANASQLGGTAQTGRDVGTSVLLSTGTGTGQLDFTSGVVKANLAQILGTALTETAGLIAAAFKQFFNVASPTGTMKAITAVTTVTTTTNLTNLPAAAATAAELAKVPKSDSTVSWNATALAAINAEVDTALNTAIPGSPTADSINERIVAIDGYGTPPAVGAIADAVWDEVTSGHTTAGTSGKALSDASTATGLDAAGVRSAVGLASANLDTQLADLPTNLELAAGFASADDAVLSAIGGLNDVSAADILAAAASAPIDANVKEVNDVALAGTGVVSDKWRPA